MFRLSASRATRGSFNTLTSIFLRVSHTFHPSASSNWNEYRSPSALRFEAQIKWHQFAKVLMFTCELLNENLSLKVGLRLLVRYVKCARRVEIKNYTKPDFANCILERSSKDVYLSFLLFWCSTFISYSIWNESRPESSVSSSFSHFYVLMISFSPVLAVSRLCDL